MKDKIEFKIWDQVKHKVWDQVYSHTSGNVRYHVGWLVSDQVRDQVLGQLKREINNER